MIVDTNALLFLAALGAAWLIWKTVVVPDYIHHLRQLPGPKRASYIRGNMARIFEAGPGEAHKQWLDESGSAVVRYTTFFGKSRLAVTDPKALQHILLNHAYDYPKPQQIRGDLGRMLGKGILFAEGDDHRRQKRIMAPAFTEARVRELAGLFYDKTAQMVEQLRLTVATEKELDVTRWLSRVTLDIIGLAGFGYDFHALDSEEGSDSPLYQAFAGLLTTPVKQSFWRQAIFALSILFPPAGRLPTSVKRQMAQRFAVMQSEGEKIIEAKRAELAEASKDNKDLITLLLKANSKEETKAQMTDTELLGQITTFQLAGHETSSSALTWALHHLSLQPDIQAKLRNEIRQAKADLAPGEHLRGDQIAALPYCDAVVREVLRLCPPVPGTIRTAGKDDVIPLSQPITLKSGKTISNIEVKQGDSFFIPMVAFNQNAQVWGPDVMSFRPERWLDGSNSGASSSAGFLAYSPLLTFLGGPRACIGYRFSVLETKVILSELVAAFEFSQPAHKPEIIGKSAITTRPYVRGKEQEGAQLPLKVKCL